MDHIGCYLWWKLDRTTTWPIYRFGLCRKWNWIVGSYLTDYALWWKLDRIMTWLIIQVHSTLKSILHYHNWSNQVSSMKKIRDDNDVTNCTGVVNAENDTNFHDQSDRVSTVTKSRYDNNVTNHTNVIYIKNEIELSWYIEPGLVSDKIQIGQQRDKSYRYSLRWNRNSTVETYLTVCSLWWQSDRTTTSSIRLDTIFDKY